MNRQTWREGRREGERERGKGRQKGIRFRTLIKRFILVVTLRNRNQVVSYSEEVGKSTMKLYRPAVPSRFPSTDRFCGRQFFHRRREGEGYGEDRRQSSGGNSSKGLAHLLLCGLVPNRPRPRNWSVARG